MITIENIKVSANFKYLWLKYVKDINLNVHCAKSLIGTYSKKIKTTKGEYSDIILDEAPYKAIYLCGVAIPYIWENNFHLAFKYAKGESFTYSSNGIDITVKDAVRLPIEVSDIDITHPKAKFKSYYTCRNWQFAHYFNKNIK